jgi:serine/threonine protein kinase
VIELEEGNITVLVLEYIEGGELFDYIVARKKLKENEACRFFRQIVSAVEVRR